MPPDAPAARHPPGADPLRTGALMPEAVGRYKVLRLLGEGAFGRVFLALDPTLDQDVAIKVPASVHLTDQFLDRFRREGRAAARVKHPNVCRVLNADQTPEGRPYFVFDYVDGPNLATHVTSLTRLDAADAARIMAAVARGVAAAHAVGVIHRDLKPANVLMDQRRGYEPIVTDFGVARLVGMDGPTLAGMPVGTLAYMPPEQGIGRHDQVGPWSDVYSLGVMLYELVIGDVPSKTQPLFLSQMAGQPTPRPSVVLTTVPKAVCEVATKAMRADPENRYRSAEEFAAALEDWLRTRRRAGPPVPPPPAPPRKPKRGGFRETTLPEHRPRSPAWGGGRIRAVVVGGAVGLAAAAAGIAAVELAGGRAVARSPAR